MALPAQFGGILPPVCTPLTESCDVDIASLRRLLDFHLTAGVHGIFLLGTSSETTLLSDRQRATVIETGINAVGGRVPVIVGVLDTSTAAVIDQARTAQELGADAIVVTAPFYVSVNQAEILEHFRRVRSAVDLPILAYDIPVTVHSKLAKETVLKLAREGTIVGIKDSSGDEGNLRSLVVEGRDIPGFASLYRRGAHGRPLALLWRERHRPRTWQHRSERLRPPLQRRRGQRLGESTHAEQDRSCVSSR